MSEPKYIMDFARALCPDAPDLFLSTSTEESMLTEATEQLTAVRTERDQLREELHTAKTDRDGWAVRSKADFDRLGVALEPVRRKRPTGEPACSDGEAVEELVAERDRLRKALYAIENTPPANIQNQVAASEQWWKRLVTDMQNQARRALQGGRDDK